jgi:hypothetical protein
VEDKPEKSPSDSLEGLLRGSQKGEATRPVASPGKRPPAAAPAQLSDLLGGASGDRRGFAGSARLPGKDLPHDDPQRLEGMLQGRSTTAPAAPAHSPPSRSVPRPFPPDLDALLRPAHPTAEARDTGKKAAAPSAEALGAILEGHGVPTRAQDAEIPEITNRFYLSRQTLAWIGGALVLIAGIAAWYTLHARIKVPDSEVARQLMIVVGGVESYKAANRTLPEHLSVLKEFPQGAVEFEMAQYDVQLADPKLELFYVAVDADYYVVARYYDEAWVYKGEHDPQLIRAPAR